MHQSLISILFNRMDGGIFCISNRSPNHCFILFLRIFNKFYSQLPIFKINFLRKIKIISFTITTICKLNRQLLFIYILINEVWNHHRQRNLQWMPILSTCSPYTASKILISVQILISIISNFKIITFAEFFVLFERVKNHVIVMVKITIQNQLFFRRFITVDNIQLFGMLLR